MASGVRLFLRRQLYRDGISSLALKRATRCPSAVRVVRFYTVPYGEKAVEVFVRQGFPVVTLPLPSRGVECEFTLRPYLQNVGNFLQDVQAEDKGVERIGVYSTDGNRVAMSTGLDLLLRGDFDVLINDTKFRVQVPENAYSVPLIGEQSLSDVRNMTHKLYTSLHVDKHQLYKERELRAKIEDLYSQLAPLEAQYQQLARRSEVRTNWAVWACMAYMSMQSGFFARLTFVDYSWDIMEPITYFVTYGTSMACFAYFILTKQDAVYPDARDRQFLNFFYRLTSRSGFDVAKYNHLKDAVARVEGELKRLRDPLLLNLPTVPISPPQAEEQEN